MYVMKYLNGSGFTYIPTDQWYSISHTHRKEREREWGASSYNVSVTHLEVRHVVHGDLEAHTHGPNLLPRVAPSCPCPYPAPTAAPATAAAAQRDLCGVGGHEKEFSQQRRQHKNHLYLNQHVKI